MIMVHHDRREHFMQFLIPMQDESHADMFQTNSATWMYYCDGKRHGKVPVMVLHGLEDIWGGEEYIRSLGYRKHWVVFMDDRTGEYTFGNRPLFASSKYPEERQRALEMTVADVELLRRL